MKWKQVVKNNESEEKKIKMKMKWNEEYEENISAKNENNQIMKKSKMAEKKISWRKENENSISNNLMKRKQWKWNQWKWRKWRIKQLWNAAARKWRNGRNENGYWKKWKLVKMKSERENGVKISNEEERKWNENRREETWKWNEAKKMKMTADTIFGGCQWNEMKKIEKYQPGVLKSWKWKWENQWNHDSVKRRSMKKKCQAANETQCKEEKYTMKK
jgi:hypothetical protein